jgi:uridylate kinase
LEINKPKRIVLKLSGESLKGDLEFGLDAAIIKTIATEIKKTSSLNVQISIVAGGGNFWRGIDYEKRGMDRSTADYAGMLATIMNALALQDELEKNKIEVRTQSALNLPSVAEPYIRRKAIRHLEKGRLVLFAGGTGNPFMSTDTAAALRAIEINADLLIMAKNGIDGMYDSDPKINSEAKKIDKITHHEALSKRLSALDSTALTLCMDNNLPIVIFDLFKSDNLFNVISGNKIGTQIYTPNKS